MPVEQIQQKLQQLRERRSKCEEQLKSLEENNASELSETDPESRGMRKVGVGKKDFEYDAEQNVYRCPQGAVLKATVEFEKRGQPHAKYENPGAWAQCPLKAQCTLAAHRSVTRWKEEAIIDRMHERVASNPQIVRHRKALVEHVFGTTMFWMNQRPLLMRGLEKVRAEFTLTALSYNITRVLNLVGVEELLKKLAAMRSQTGSKAVLAAIAQISGDLGRIRRSIAIFWPQFWNAQASGPKYMLV